MIETNTLLTIAKRWLKKYWSNAMKDKVITIRLDEELLNELKTISDKEYRPMSLQIRKMLTDWIKTEKERVSQLSKDIQSSH